MQAVFEKIIEKLEDAKNNVPVNRLLDDIIKDKPKELGQLMAYNKSIEIVKQEAEQFGSDTNVGSNVWIPCNELLPAYGQTVLASVCAEDAEWKIIIACYKEEDFWLDGKIDAWQPLPTPYAKGE